MNRVEVWMDDASLGGSALVGQLSKTASRTGDTISFEYDPHWLASAGPVAAFPLDHEFYFGTGPQYARAGANELSGAFQDCSPDRWGKRLMDRREAVEAREQERRVRSLRAWDYLVGVNDESRMGALRLVDPASGRYVDDRTLSAPPVTDLRQLEAIAAHVERADADLTDEMVRWIKQIVAPGASLGGARPKASFRDPAGQLWLAKFPSNDDRVNVGLWEFLAYQLSLDAGIDMPEARLMQFSDRGHTYAVQRFDRTSTSRRMFSSAMTQLDVSESEGHSYLDLVQVIETSGTSTQIASDLEQLFRRVLFNVLIGNRDDHLRNHGFLRAGDGWRLSPAFDVNPNPDKDHHVLAIDGSDPSPDSSLLLATADYYRLSRNTAAALAEHVRAAVRGWETRARALGAPAGEIALMRGVIDPDR
ncbi:serine/threonine-protein kinase HipA [Pseudoxanthomonas wuyuanensis]|uniref:Serine/threonine-protein kinase HipA n=2 Tax=Pseudoxanthomonas wuyuanensis TaxID=1073196 RepID=A0A286DF72_9GAMM|nr:type II toxin-antitoxin system HipA family toxin [Pseudoxanthomonas wuyuanensis]SOD57229.1 serine/threonine-protein kinase HipA [Pseudoxanthomonas wuyuanensis]